MADLGSLIVRLGVDSTGVLTAKVEIMQLAKVADQAAVQATASMSRFSKATIGHINAITQRLRTFGYLASAVLTAPMIAAGKSALNMAKDFEFAMAKVQGLAGISPDVTKQWSEGLLQMAPEVATDPQKLANTLYFVASAGFKTAEAMTITEMAAKGAATGMGEAAAIADMLVSAMNAYKTSGLTAAHAMDIFTAAVREGKIEPEAFVSSIGSVLPIASELGVSLDQVTAAMAAMSLSGASAANAATYLRNVLQKLADPSAEVEKSLATMKTSGDALRRSLAEKGLLPTLEELRRLTEEYGTTMFEIFPNIRALIGALNLTGQNLEYNRKLFELVKNSAGDFGDAFQVAAQTIQFRMNAALAEARVAMIKFGEAISTIIVPALEWLVERLKNLVNWYTNLSEASKKLVTGIAAFLTVIGPLSLLISALSYGFTGLVSILKVLKPVVISVTGALGIMSTVLGGIAIAGVIAGVSALVKQFVQWKRSTEEWENVQKRANDLVIDETFRINELFNVLKNNIARNEDRKTSIDAINNQYGSYLQNMLDEKDTLAEITAAQDLLTRSMERRLMLEEMSEEKTKLSGELAKSYRKYLMDYVRTYQESIKVMGKTPIKGPEMTAAFINDLEDTANRLAKSGAGKFTNAAHYIVKGFYNTWLKDIGDIDYNKLFDAVWEYAQDTKQIQPTLDATNDLIKAYTSGAIAVDAMGESTKRYYDDIGDKTLKSLIVTMQNELDLLDKEEIALTKAGRVADTAARRYDVLKKAMLDIAQQVKPDKSAIWIKRIGEWMDDYADKAKKAGIETETLEEIMTAYEGKVAGIKEMARQAYELGTEFKYASEMSKTILDTMDKVVQKGGKNEQALIDLATALHNLHPEIYDTADVLKTYGEQLDFINNKSQIGVAGYNAFDEMGKAAETALDKLIKLRFETKNIESVFVPLGGIGSMLIPLTALLDNSINKIIEDYHKWQAASEMLDMQKTIELAKKQANEYGTLDNRLDVINKEIQYNERMLYAAATATKVDEKRVRELSEALKVLRNQYVDVQHAADVDYLKMLIAAYGNFDDKMRLVSTNISYVEDKLRELAGMSVKDAAWLTDVNTWIDKLGELRAAAEKLDAIKSSLSSLGDIFQSLGDAIGGSTGDIVSWIGQIINSLPEIIDLINRFSKVKDAATLSTELETQAVQANLIYKNQEVAASAGSVVAKSNELVATSSLVAAKQTEVVATQMGIATKSADTVASTSSAAASTVSAGAAYSNAGAKAVEAQASVVASGAKEPFPINLVAIVLGIAAVIAGLAAAIPKPKKMKTGGVVPPGYPDDTFPALLTSGEVVIPRGKADQYVTQLIKEKGREKEFAKGIPEMQHGGTIPAGFPNDTYPAWLTSGETVIPKAQSDLVEQMLNAPKFQQGTPGLDYKGFAYGFKAMQESMAGAIKSSQTLGEKMHIFFADFATGLLQVFKFPLTGKLLPSTEDYEKGRSGDVRWQAKMAMDAGTYAMLGGVADAAVGKFVSLLPDAAKAIKGSSKIDSRKLYKQISKEPERLLYPNEIALLQKELDTQGILNVQKTWNVPGKEHIRKTVEPRNYDIKEHFKQLFDKNNLLEYESYLERLDEVMKDPSSRWNLDQINRQETWGMYLGYPQSKGENQLYNISSLSTNKAPAYTINPNRFNIPISPRIPTKPTIIPPQSLERVLSEFSEYYRMPDKFGDMIKFAQDYAPIKKPFEQPIGTIPQTVDPYFGTMGGHSWGVKPLESGNLQFTAEDVWDLKPLQSVQSEANIPEIIRKALAPFKNIEVGSALKIGKPLNVKVGFEFDPIAKKIIKTFSTIGVTAGGLALTGEKASAAGIEGEKATKKYPDVFKIIDERTTDLITGKPVSDYSRLHGEFDLSFLEEVVKGAFERGIDPYTALAITHQETGGTPSGSGNPFNIQYSSQAQLEKMISDPIGGSLDTLVEKLKIAARLGKDNYAAAVQVYNGLGKITEGSFGRTKAYGLDIPEEGISMKENPLYGKRIEDVRNNILLQNEELVRYVESIAVNYPKPTLPYIPPKPEEPHALETTIGVDTTQALTEATVALDNYLQTFGIFNEKLDVLTTETNAATQGITNAAFAAPTFDNPFGGYEPKPLSLGPTTIGNGEFGGNVKGKGSEVQAYKNTLAAATTGIGSIVQTAAKGGDVGQAALGAVGSVGGMVLTELLTPILSVALPGIGTILGPLIGGLFSGLFGLIGSGKGKSGFVMPQGKFAKGGVVPAGYPNDTYPAMLTSHEVVLPQDKYKEYLRFVQAEKKPVKEYQDAPEMEFKPMEGELDKLTKQGATPSGSVSDELQLLLSTYEINFPEEKFKSLFAPLMKQPKVAQEAINKKKITSKIYNYNNVTEHLTKISKAQAVKNNALTKIKQESNFALTNNLAKVSKGLHTNDKSLSYLSRVTKTAKETPQKSRPFARTAAEHISNNQTLDKISKMKKTNEKSLNYLTKISRETSLTESRFKKADYYPRVAKMATGGSVPAGYPNDTFPAMLSSGEHVLPKNVMSNLKGISAKPQKLHITVDGKIAGKDLMLALRRANLTN